MPVVGAAHGSASVAYGRYWADRLLYISAVLPFGSPELRHQGSSSSSLRNYFACVEEDDRSVVSGTFASHVGSCSYGLITIRANGEIVAVAVRLKRHEANLAVLLTGGSVRNAAFEQRRELLALVGTSGFKHPRRKADQLRPSCAPASL